MRVVTRVIAALLVLFGAALVALLVLLPRYVDSPAVRERILAAAREWTGRDVNYRSLRFGFFPPRLVVEEPQVAAAAEGEKPAFAAEGVDLQFSLLPLLARHIVIDSLAVKGAQLSLVRTSEGIELPGKQQSRDPKPAKDNEPETGADETAAAEQTPGTDSEEENSQQETTEAEGGGVGFAVRELSLQRASLALEDRTRKPPVTWQLTDVNAEARALSLRSPIAFTLSGSLASNGHLRAEGEFQHGGFLNTDVKLEAVELAPFEAYMTKQEQLRGAVTGTLHYVTAQKQAPQLKADLKLAQGNLVFAEVALRGALSLVADLAGSPLAGTFEIDATQAQVVYGDGVFDKPPGTPATASGRLLPAADGAFAVDDVHVRVHNLDAHGRLESDARTRIALSAPAFALEGWETLLGAFQQHPLSGSLALQDVVLATSPLELRGQIAVDGVRVPIGEQGGAILHGTLQGTGPAVTSENLELRAGTERIVLAGSRLDLEGAQRFRFIIKTENADAQALSQALTGDKGRLEGPLTFTGDLSGRLHSKKSPLSTLDGRAQLAAGPGYLRGISLLQRVFERIGAVGAAAHLATAFLGERLLPFYSEDYQSITGTFDVVDGVARTQDLRVVRKHHSVDLRGSFGLADQRLDATGTLTIGAEVNEALAAGAGGDAEAAQNGPRERVIPLARVTGTIGDPKVEISRKTMVAFLGGYALTRQLGTLERKIGERIGEDKARELLEKLGTKLEEYQRENP